MTIDKKKTRSSAYQWILVERCYSSEMMGSFSNDDGIHKKLNPFDYNEDILVLEDQLKERFWEIINEHLTDRQREIVDLLKEGKTQMETATKLGINQSSITKCISGDTLIKFKSGEYRADEIYASLTKGFIFADIPIYCLNEETREIVPTKLLDVVKGEEKEMIRIVSDSGKAVKASRDHKFFTDKGWMRLGDVVEAPGTMLTVWNEGGAVGEFEGIRDWSSVGMEVSYDLSVEGPWHNFFGSSVAIQNSLHGNTEYSNPDKKTSYGGIVRKIRKVVDNDPVVKEILEKISEIRNNSWM